jgi:flagellar biosynthesis chaperone FliJ
VSAARRNRLKTLVRVAELQEAVAKGHAAKALLATRAAEAAAAEQLRALRESRLAGGTREALTSSAQQQQALAASVVEANAVAAEAAQAQREAVSAWTSARRRHKLFDELAERKRDEAEAERERHEQLLADELAAMKVARR